MDAEFHKMNSFELYAISIQIKFSICAKLKREDEWQIASANGSKVTESVYKPTSMWGVVDVAA